MQKNVGEILYNFKKVLVPEINLGQLIKVLRAKYLVPAVGLNKVQGLPFTSIEIESKIVAMLKGEE
jgi:2-oxoglutarate ferredoxin oxidoreductase subunit alpha